jgi:chromosome segregation protein
MLKALELVGFKSFADKTRFEFPAGITVVVGPNGSGKSNVVDAIKWVLGEQSAKSLRGKDMSDVIFKGAGGTGGRKPMNTAEATIVIDNSDARIPVDAPEVHVTRRVYRSGEGEYLINRQPCRLKDIKDLFRGTGAGADAYSLIEQGKVDRLLQASPKDRRAIFEEAAGISRFKAKKVEAQRRLERVDQNLLRLSDIVEEVESRLRSVRSQASKARRYKEYSERLQQLRTQVGLTDWRRLSEQLEEVETKIELVRNQIAETTAAIESVEARSLEIDVAIVENSEGTRSCEGDLARNRERIASHQSSVAQQRARIDDYVGEAHHLREQLLQVSSRAGDVLDRLRDTSAKLEDVEASHRQQRSSLEEGEREFAELDYELEQLRVGNEERRIDYVDRMRTAAQIENRVSSCKSRVEAADTAAQRHQIRQSEIEQQSQEALTEFGELQKRILELDEVVETNGQAVERIRGELTQQRAGLSSVQESLANLQERYGGVTQRSQVLEDLEQKREGIASGVKEVLARAGAEPDGPFGDVQGLVADLIEADVNIAPLIDVALGEAAQRVVVEGRELIDLLKSQSVQVEGRVGFIRREHLERNQASDGPTLHEQPGVIGRAAEMVQVSIEYRSIVRHLLGRTWLVEDLVCALSLQEVYSDKRLRFVTRKGELLDADGTLVVGSRQAEAGLISRRSELQSLRDDSAELEREISQAKTQVDQYRTGIERLEQQLASLELEHRQAEEERFNTNGRLETVRERQTHLDQLNKIAASERNAAELEKQSAQSGLREAEGKLLKLQAEINELEAEINSAEEAIESLEPRRNQQQRHLTDAKIELAKCEQHLESLLAQVSQFEEDRRERGQAIQEIYTQLDRVHSKQQLTERDILASTSELALLFLRKHLLADSAQALAEMRAELAGQRSRIAEDVQRHRKQLRDLEATQHESELNAGQTRHQRSTLAERMRDDYGIELEQVSAATTEEEEVERQEVEEEIAALRRKINNIGAVNMDALEELEELEDRFGSLSAQHRDLIEAKQALERIITKINADSRRLFVETLEAIRINFQALYRRAFGGGKADIVLEEGTDVLEGGIEIMANPPGKPQFNNSLLSGGEKALTAVSLLLAIFQFRPSPFCVLDEVDAPFDEANIGRFVDVLKEFLGWTKFVIVTHSKKTMTAATTLYGVTMQESGVSKRVSVQFDDVSEDGHISQDAIERDQDVAEGDSGEDERGAA